MGVQVSVCPVDRHAGGQSAARRGGHGNRIAAGGIGLHGVGIGLADRCRVAGVEVTARTASVAVAVAAAPILPAASVKVTLKVSVPFAQRGDVDAGDLLRGRGHAAAAA